MIDIVSFSFFNLLAKFDERIKEYKGGLNHIMSSLSVFLDKDHERADKELACYDYLTLNASRMVANGEFGKAAAYYENTVRSLRELQFMKDRKESVDKAVEILRQIDKQEVARRYWF